MPSRISFGPALLGLLATLSLLLVLTATAAALPPECDQPEDCPESPPVEHTNTLTVTAPAVGTVTGTGIACPGDCSEDYEWTENCFDTPGPGPDKCETNEPTIVLTASRGTGWTPDWTGCDSVSSGQCSVVMNVNHTVSVAWQDAANPTVGFSSPPAKAGPNTVFTATASDNNAISQVAFYIDDVLRSTDTSAPYQLSMSGFLSLYTDGTSHELKVVATDAAGRQSSSLAAAPSHQFVVDKSTGLASLSTPSAYVQSAPAISFTRPADVAVSGVTCTTKLGSDVRGTTSSCASPYAPQLGTSPPDGAYTVEFQVTDDVGNVATLTRTFTLDRVAPTLGVTSPDDDAILSDPFTPATTVSDAFTPSGQIVVTCRIDAGAFGSCASLAPADGSRTLTVRATDLAGNFADETVPFTYDATAPVVTITEGPEQDSVSQATSATFRFTVDDITAVTTTCKVDDAAFGPCTAADRHDLTGLGVGVHTLAVRAVDAAGNATEVERRFAVAAPTAGPTGSDGTGTGTGTGTPGTGVPPGPGGAGPGGPSGGTSLPSGPGAGGGPAALPLQLQITRRWRVRRGRTKVLALKVRGLAPGATVVLTCKGRGCPFRSRTRTARAATLDLRGLFRKRALRAGAVITVRVTLGGRTGLLRFTTRSGRRAPKTSTPTVR